MMRRSTFSVRRSLVAWGGWCRHHGHGGCHGHSHASSHSHSLNAAELAAMSEDHRAQCQRATIVGGVSNVLMAAVKIALGNSGGSQALVADGLHALVDVASDLVSYSSIALTSVTVARCRFPFGLGRIETAGAVVVSSILLIGSAMLLWGSARRLISLLHCDTGSDDHAHGHDGNDTSHGHSHGGDAVHGHSHFEVMSTVDGRKTILWEMVVVAALSIVVKEWLYRWTKRVGERAGSRVVVANAYHHRADAWSSGVALAGVAGHLVGFPILDSLAGLVVSFSIGKIGWDLLSSCVLDFFDYQYVHETSKLRSSVQGVSSTLVPPAVNIFSARHGASSVLHATFIVPPSVTGLQLQSSIHELTSASKKVMTISETFAKFIHIPPSFETLPSDLRLLAFRESAKEIESFHGFTIQHCSLIRCADDGVIYCNIDVVSSSHHDDRSDCFSDLRTLANVYKIIIEVKPV